MYKKGDLLKFNREGRQLFRFISGSVGVIVSDPKVAYEYDFHSIPEKLEYQTYDILVCGQLFTDVPELFLERIMNNEKNNKRMEDLPRRDD